MVLDSTEKAGKKWSEHQSDDGDEDDGEDSPEDEGMTLP